MDKKIILKHGNEFTDEEKHEIIQEWLEIGCTKRDIWEKYTGQVQEHGYILKWMRQFGYETEINIRKRNIVSNYDFMTKNKKENSANSSADANESFENLQLKKRIADLEKQLKDAELKAIAFSTMVDIAEKEFKIPIRKKLNTKP